MNFAERDASGVDECQMAELRRKARKDEMGRLMRVLIGAEAGRYELFTREAAGISTVDWSAGRYAQVQQMLRVGAAGQIQKASVHALKASKGTGGVELI